MPTYHRTPPEGNNAAPRVIEIELLALDLDHCTRCTGTLRNIETAIETVRPVLEATGARVGVSTLVIESEEQAREHQFVASPTVRVNGKDIAFETLESKCESCTELCGCDEETSCRVWPYRGEEHTEAPVGLVVESILSEIYAPAGQPARKTPGDAEVPENLRRFFAAKSAARAAAKSCCPPATQQTCCEPTEKEACCDDSEPQACGCR